MKSLEGKIQRIRARPESREFILADAKDADMCWGVPSFGKVGSDKAERFRTRPEFLEQIRQIVHQGLIDIMLASLSTMSQLAHREKLFVGSEVAPAIRANDTTDVWCPRGGKYREHPSLCFSTPFIEEAQYGSVAAISKEKPLVNLGLYSVTFNNRPELDRETLMAFREFRAEARRKGFHYFLEVFSPNIDIGLHPEEFPGFVNDHICRMLAGVSLDDRPLFLKVPYFGPQALEELVAYDPAMIIGIMGGGTGTTFDAFQLLADAQKYGARAALFGRKIKDAEDPLAFIKFMRAIVNGDIRPADAVRAYHSELEERNISPRRQLSEDLKVTSAQIQKR